MAVRTCLAPDASKQGIVLSLGGHETNPSTVPVLSSVLSVRLPGPRRPPRLQLPRAPSLEAQTNVVCALPRGGVRVVCGRAGRLG